MGATEELGWHLAEVGYLGLYGLSLSGSKVYVLELILAEDGACIVLVG